MQFSPTESRILQYCFLTCHFQSDIISKQIKLETRDCAQMKGLSSNYPLAICFDPLHGYLGPHIPKTLAFFKFAWYMRSGDMPANLSLNRPFFDKVSCS